MEGWTEAGLERAEVMKALKPVEEEVRVLLLRLLHIRPFFSVMAPASDSSFTSCSCQQPSSYMMTSAQTSTQFFFSLDLCSSHFCLTYWQDETWMKYLALFPWIIERWVTYVKYVRKAYIPFVLYTSQVQAAPPGGGAKGGDLADVYTEGFFI